MKKFPTLAKCGIKYPADTLVPPNARWALYYWGYVIYHRTKKAAESSVGQLNYYEAEDAEILPVNKRAKTRR
jgi:hypothetical protein